MSKNRAKQMVATASISTAAFFGMSYLVFREIMYRNAKLMPAIAEMTAKAMEKKAPQEPDARVLWFEQQHFDEFTIDSERGTKLRGYLLKADSPSDVYVFCSHGYRSCGKNEFNCMTKFYHDKGFNVFLIDHQASGESEGSYIGFGYYEYKDLLHWLDFLTNTFGKDIQIILHGVSMGSATVMLACGDSSLPTNVKFTVADCGYTSAWNEFAYILKFAHVPSFPLLQGTNMMNKRINGYAFKDVDVIGSVRRIRLPILFIHGKADTFVPTYMAGELYEACTAEHKDLLLVDDAWHAESYRKNTVAYEEKVTSYIDRFITTEPAKAE